MNRYDIGSGFPQPIRKIQPAVTDILHPFKAGERIDNLAYKYYKDPTLGWIIMCANPEFDNELEIPFGTKVRIPYPLNRVLAVWHMNKEV